MTMCILLIQQLLFRYIFVLPTSNMYYYIYYKNVSVFFFILDYCFNHLVGNNPAWLTYSDKTVSTVIKNV